MGVAGLWKLLLPIGRRISLETLAGKVLAIDASIWWIQLEQALRRREGNNQESSTATFALLIKLFLHRLCKLTFYNIRPVFVLDGKTPEIKLQTLRKRRKRGQDESYERSERHLQRMAKQLLQKQLLLQSNAKKKNESAVVGETRSDATTANNGDTRTAAFASGFDPGAQRRKPPPQQQQQQQQQQKEDGIDRSSESPPFIEQPREEVIILDNEDVESVGNAKQHHSSPNDWDDDASSTESTFEIVDEMNTHTSFHTNNSQHDMKQQIQSVWRMPSHERKAALEQMQRQYRLQSRKEFMPAAAQPQIFSQVQLKHFLKSCQLRQAIVSQHSVGSNNATGKKRKAWGQPTAYDRSVRVELIRENDFIADDSLEEGGFVVYDEKKSAESASLEENEDMGGGFFVDRKKSRMSLNDCVSESRVAAGTMPNEKTDTDDKMDAIIQQEQMLQDQQLAEALQSVEYEDESEPERNVNVSEDFAWQYQPKNVVNDKKPPACSPFEVNDDSDVELGDQPKNNLNDTKQSVGSPIEVNDDSDIEWEEGDATEETSNFEGQCGREEEEEDGIYTDQIATEPANDDHDSQLRKKGNEEDSDDDEVRIVNASSIHGIVRPVPEEVVKKSFDAAPTKISHDNDAISNNLQTDDDEPSYMKPITKPTALRNTSSFESDGFSQNESRNTFADDHSNLSQSFTSNTEALEQAQKTASNLANWAGRVFRRAMKEVHEASEASPVTKNETRLEIIETVEPSPSRNLDVGKDTAFEANTIDLAAEVDANVPVQRDDATVMREPRSAYIQESRRETLRRAFDLLEGFDPSILALTDAQIEEGRMQRQRDEENGAGEMRDEMRETLLQLLRLFGVPYVEAPAEAEAQCVELERLGLVDGIVTEDSDAFVFGGNTIYKNMFDEMKYVEVYRASDAEKEMSLGKNEMVALAMLLGGDYTEGVRGVGIVNAMEVLDAFDMSQGPKHGLLNFREWLTSFNPLADASTELKEKEGQLSKFDEFSRKHRSAKTRWETPGNFPSDRVLTAYMSPVVDNSSDKFSWGTPDVENLVPFCAQYIGWSREETIKVLEPVTKKANSGYHQTRIDSFMKYEDSIKFAKVRSKRLRKVLGLEEQTGETSQLE